MMVALPDLVGSATLLAVTVTVGVPEMGEGAVYRPVKEMLPNAGLIDHVTAWFELPCTVAENCCCWLAVKFAEAGVTETETPAVLFELMTTNVPNKGAV